MRRAAVFVFILAVGAGPSLVYAGPPKGRPAGGAPKAGATQGPKGAPAGPRGQTGPKGQATAPRAASGPKSGAPTKGSGGPKAPASAGKAANPSGTARGRQADRTADAAATGTVTRGQRVGDAAGSAPTADGSDTPIVPGSNVPKNPKLQAKLQAMLPPGMLLQDAAAGFKNQGQFVAALHVSSNLGVPFEQLKLRMVDDGLSLGQTVQALRPGIDGAAEARRGEQQAASDLR